MFYPTTFPSKAPATERLTLNRKQSATESSFTYAMQVVQTASQWQLEWTWGPMSHVRAEALAGWLLGLRGQIGSFRYYPRQSVAGVGSPATAQVAYAYNTTLLAGGWQANAPTNLRPGQFMQVGEQLLRIVSASATGDANGRASITFEPELRIAFAVNTSINLVNPSGVFRLASSDGVGFTLDPDRKPELGSYQAREVV